MKIVHTGLNTFDADKIYSIRVYPAPKPTMLHKLFGIDCKAVAVKITLGDDPKNFVMVHMKDMKAAATLQVSLALIMLSPWLDGKRILIDVETGMFTIEEDGNEDNILRVQ